MNNLAYGERKRICHLVLSLTRGGTERLVVDMCLASQARAESIEVICLDEFGPWSAPLVEVGIPVNQLQRKPGFRPSIALQIRRLLLAQHAQVIHCHQYTPFIYGSLASLITPNVKLIYTEHGRFSDAAPTLKRQMANRFFRRIPGTHVAVSKALKAHIVSEGFDPETTRVVYNGVAAVESKATSAAARRELGLNHGDRVFGTVARLDPVKDLGTLVHAFDFVSKAIPDAKLVVVGDGPCRQELTDLTKALGLTDRVLFTGESDQVKTLLPAFDVFINCSTMEGISVTLLEAMSLEVPVIATAVGGTPELIVDGVSGRLVAPRNAQQLGNEMLALSHDDNARKQLALGGYARFADQFSLLRMLDEYWELYQSP